ncbi:forkhead protein/ forkhead protein domain,putative [Schistosoma mansoni]|nr:forkhead protein/ forkhead protein domain,putative [Schistosoma mansoni]|eukprot:XP_018647262.1 forkhead protein/ forkhead protein domain,putative [Schistosoma mansoni]
MEQNISPSTITVGLSNASGNTDSYLRRLVTKSPLEAMAQRFGHVVREFQINLPSQINKRYDNLQCSDDLTTFPVNPRTTSSSSLMYPYFTPIPPLHYFNAVTTTITTTVTSIATTSIISNISPDSSPHSVSKLPLLLSKPSFDYFHSKLCETVSISENLSKITSFSALKQSCSRELHKMNDTDTMTEDSSDPFISSDVFSLNSVQHSHEKQNFRNPLCVRSSHLNSLQENQFNETNEYELHSFVNEATTYGLNLSFQNDKMTKHEKSYHNFENCHHGFLNGTNHCDMSNSNNLSIFECKNCSYPNNLINSNLCLSKCDHTEAYSSSMFNNSSETYNCSNHSVKYPASPSNIYLNKSIPMFWSNDCNNPNVKPPFSYITLIVSAMNSKLSKKITLNEIYAWIMHTFVYYRKNTRRWQNSIRHALSFNDCFIKVPRPSGEAGKGSYWTVHPLAIDMFDNGSSMRRNRKFIDENRYRHNHNHATIHMNGKKYTSIKNYGINLLSHPPHYHHQSRVNMNKSDNVQWSIMIKNNNNNNSNIQDFISTHSNSCDKYHQNEDDDDGDNIDGYMDKFTRKVKESTLYNNNDNNINSKNHNYKCNSKDDHIKTITMLNPIKSPSTTTT